MKTRMVSPGRTMGFRSDGLGDQLLGVVHYHHGAVIQVSDALVVLLAFLEDEDPHGLAGQDDGFQIGWSWRSASWRCPLPPWCRHPGKRRPGCTPCLP